jgi:hypothetical protein
VTDFSIPNIEQPLVEHLALMFMLSALGGQAIGFKVSRRVQGSSGSLRASEFYVTDQKMKCPTVPIGSLFLWYFVIVAAQLADEQVSVRGCHCVGVHKTSIFPQKKPPKTSAPLSVFLAAPCFTLDKMKHFVESKVCRKTGISPFPVRHLPVIVAAS